MALQAFSVMLLYAVIPPTRPLRKDAAWPATGSRRSGLHSPPLIVEECPTALTPLATSRVHLPRSSAIWQRRSHAADTFPPCCLHDQQFWQSFKPTKWRGVRRLDELDGLSEVVIRAQSPELDHESDAASEIWYQLPGEPCSSDTARDASVTEIS